MKYPYEIITGRKEKVIDLKQYAKLISGKKILVAGIGSIGRPLVGRLADFGAQLAIIDMNEENLSKTRDLLDAKSHKSYKLYLQDLKLGIPNGMSNFDFVINTAAYKHVFFSEQNEDIVLWNNISICQNLLKIRVKYKHILISTDKAVYPNNVMGKTKRVCEIMYLLNDYGKIIRFGNVYGSSGSLIPRVAKGIEYGVVHSTSRNVTRYFMTINEACSLIIKAMFNENVLDILEMGEPLNIRKIIDKMIEYSGKEVIVKEVGLQDGEKTQEILRYKQTMPRYKFAVLQHGYSSPYEIYNKLQELEYDVE